MADQTLHIATHIMKTTGDLLLSAYTANTAAMNIKCSICSAIYRRSWNAINISRRPGCPCRYKPVSHKLSIFARELNQAGLTLVDAIDDISDTTFVVVKCLLGHQFNVTRHSFLKSSNCPKCVQPRSIKFDCDHIVYAPMADKLFNTCPICESAIDRESVNKLLKQMRASNLISEFNERRTIDIVNRNYNIYWDIDINSNGKSAKCCINYQRLLNGGVKTVNEQIHQFTGVRPAVEFIMSCRYYLVIGESAWVAHTLSELIDFDNEDFAFDLLAATQIIDLPTC